MSVPSGIAVRLNDRRYRIAFDRVAFVAPRKAVTEGRVVMPRGELPLVDPRPHLGIRPGSGTPTALVVRGQIGFYAIAVDEVELLEGSAEAEDLPELDLSGLLPEEDERNLLGL